MVLEACLFSDLLSSPLLTALADDKEVSFGDGRGWEEAEGVVFPLQGTAKQRGSHCDTTTQK